MVETCGYRMGIGEWDCSAVSEMEKGKAADQRGAGQGCALDLGTLIALGWAEALPCSNVL